MFQDALQAVMLDEVVNSGIQPSEEQMLQAEICSLCSTRHMLSLVSICDATQPSEQMSRHPVTFLL